MLICEFKLLYMNRGEGQKGMERENLKQMPHWDRAQHGAQSHDPEVMTWTEIKSQTLNCLTDWATQAPLNLSYF